MLCTRFHSYNNASVLYVNMCVCVCMYVCVRKVHDVSAQERLMHVVLHTDFLWHTLRCVCVCVLAECMYRVHNGTQWPPTT